MMNIPSNWNRGAVAPFVGAWIEIYVIAETLWDICVAPFVGAWIEITQHRHVEAYTHVAPFVGAWIEMPCGLTVGGVGIRRSVRRSVD